MELQLVVGLEILLLLAMEKVHIVGDGHHSGDGW
jgi:hypothetical protein